MTKLSKYNDFLLEKEFNSENPALLGWEGEDGKFVIPRTFDELKELINENKKHQVEESKKEWEKESLNDLSPQVKSILEYAKAGGKDVTPILEAWGTVESISQLDPNNINDAEQLIRYHLEVKGLTDDDINEQVELLKESNKLLSPVNSGAVLLTIIFLCNLLILQNNFASSLNLYFCE